MKIHACMMTQNELTDLKDNVERLLPHVDTVNIVDGGSVDLTIPFMRNWAKEEPKIRYFIHPWSDNFPAQRNNYLKRAAEVAQPGDWIFCCDPDEILDEEAATNLRALATLAASNGRNIVGFRCRGVSLKGEKRVHESQDDYWKRMLIKWTPSFKYVHAGIGPVHEGYGGIPHNIMDTGKDRLYPQTMWYEHRKQENITWFRGLRNMWIGGGGPNGMHPMIHEWKRLRQICNELGLQNWHDFQRYLLRGNIDTRVKDWMFQHRNANFGDGSSEFREAYKTYFRIYHPEEEPEELRGESIP